YVGEEDLTNFLRNYLNIGNVQDYKNGTWVMKSNPEEYECRLEHITDYFSGKFGEVKDAIALMPANKVKLLYGIRTTDEGKMYQDVYTSMVLRNNSTAFDRLEKDVKERKSNGAYPNTVFEVCELKEYVVEATTFEPAPAASDPFASDGASPWDM
ncbi:MAG: hypothetical protein HUJ76_10700, partial [Parasporobacterium sp.]|nr:hypothetical protein [Parasporobacterium sp.]